MIENCPICFEEINNENCAWIVSCNHQLCCQCLFQIMVTAKKRCPFDGSKIEQVRYLDSNDQLIESRCNKFKYHVFVHDSLQKLKIEEDFSENLNYLIIGFVNVLSKLSKEIDKMTTENSSEISNFSM